MFNISRAYVLEKDPTQKEQLKQMYLLMTKHLLDQGFVKGSALVTTLTTGDIVHVGGISLHY